jgi:Bax protein
MKHIIRNISILTLLILTTACEQPLSYFDRPQPIQSEKQFITTMTTHANEINRDIITQRTTLVETFKKVNKEGTIAPSTEQKISGIASRYKIEKFNIHSTADQKKLLTRVDVVPLSLLLAQAANESAWGTSRFAREGNNYFGISCGQPGCGLYPNNKPRKGVMQLKKFPSPHASVETYIQTLNTNRHYEQLRKMRADLRQKQKEIDGATLASGLKAYSERGNAYVREIKGLIKRYRLQEYDTA